MSSEDHRQHAPATSRNRDPILEMLRSILPPAGLVLEVASGTGEHVVHFARALPELSWQPTDPSPEARRSIADWISLQGLENVLPPLHLNAIDDEWPIGHVSAVLCINMIHISPWSSTMGLMRGASRVLDAGGPLYLYGPFRRARRPIEPTNAAFDESLRTRDPRWGLRDLDDVVTCACAHSLSLDRVIDMPANNLSVVFRRN
jgi:hypothetical protein